MAKKRIVKDRKVIQVETINPNNVVVKENYVICEVCGQANKLTQATCTKCSNYLSI